jgi:hypothetical protein
MGGLCPTGIAVSESISVEAPSETVWEVLSNLDAIPSILSSVKDIKLIDTTTTTTTFDGKIPFKVGLKFQETRYHQGKEYTMHRIVTSIQEDKHHRSVSFYCDFSETKELNRAIREICTTSTFTIVLPDANDTSSARDRCQLVGSFAIQSAGPWSRPQFRFCSPCIAAQSRRNFVVELEEYAAAAEARASKQQPRQPAK